MYCCYRQYAVVGCIVEQSLSGGRTLCASSTAMSFPVVALDSRYIPMPILNRTQAVFTSTNGQDKSMIVIVPAS